MSGPFTITAASNSVALDAQRRGEATFTVFNASGRPLQGEARLIPGAATPPILGDLARWLTLIPPAMRPFAIAESVQYRVQIAPPADAAPPPATGAPAVNCTFRLDMVGVENPDDDYSQGPTVAFVTPEVKPDEKKKFPWWILVVAGALLVAVLAILWPRSVAVPDLRGAAVGDARATLAARGLQAGDALLQGLDPQVETGRVIASTPGAGAEVKRRAAVALVVADPTATALPTVTPTPTATRTPTATATDMPTATPDRCFPADGVVLYEHVNYGGDCLPLVPGQAPWLDQFNFNDKASSIRFFGSFKSGWEAVIYSDAYYRGVSSVLKDDTPEFRSTTIGDDTASSVILRTSGP